jgi:hypothetical protein
LYHQRSEKKGSFSKSKPGEGKAEMSSRTLLGVHEFEEGYSRECRNVFSIRSLRRAIQENVVMFFPFVHRDCGVVGLGRQC